MIARDIDEVFIDATHYLKAMGCTVHEFAMLMIKDVLKQTGITATAGIGTNMFLAKVAMDSEREIVDNTLEREHRRQQAVLAIREKFGKNSILMAMNLLPGATTVTRHQQIGGHRA